MKYFFGLEPTKQMQRIVDNQIIVNRVDVHDGTTPKRYLVLIEIETSALSNVMRAMARLERKAGFAGTGWMPIDKNNWYSIRVEVNKAIYRDLIKTGSIEDAIEQIINN